MQLALFWFGSFGDFLWVFWEFFVVVVGVLFFCCCWVFKFVCFVWSVLLKIFIYHLILLNILHSINRVFSQNYV